MSKISITDITTGTLDGTGYFDELMNAIELHIEDQYVKGRIKGSDYANVYLGSIQYALQQAFQFGLSKLQTEEQVRASQVQTDLAEKQNAVDIALKLKQIEKLDEDIESLNLNDLLKQEMHDDQLLTTLSDRTIKEAQSDQDLINKQQQVASMKIDDIVKQLQADKLELDKDLVNAEIDKIKFDKYLDTYKVLASLMVDTYKTKQIEDIPTDIEDSTEADSVFTLLKANLNA